MYYGLWTNSKKKNKTKQQQQQQQGGLPGGSLHFGLCECKNLGGQCSMHMWLMFHAMVAFLIELLCF